MGTRELPKFKLVHLCRDQGGPSVCHPFSLASDGVGASFLSPQMTEDGRVPSVSLCISLSSLPEVKPFLIPLPFCFSVKTMDLYPNNLEAGGGGV